MTVEGRRAVTYTVALVVGGIVLYALLDLTRSLLEIKRSQDALKLIPVTEIRIDDLQLRGSTPATYEMRGVVHNLSPTYMLQLARFTFVVGDCLTAASCEERIRGNAEVIRDVKPNQSALFSTQSITVEGNRGLSRPRGERRITSKVWLVSARIPDR